MTTVADEIKKLTSDPGARRLGEYIDKLQAQITTLQQKVADCCDPSPVVNPTPPTPS